MREKYELLKLQNEKRNAVIKVIFENDQYHVIVAGLKQIRFMKMNLLMKWNNYWKS